ncbi:MAG: LpqB family beta-propeller domain-containing protein, partial [Pseudohongiellaceae bacterium]
MSKLFEELKRRKVVRVAGVYAVVAWLLIQVADVVLPTFGAPAWVNQTLVFLFIIGFPVALVLAWAFEVTPAGVQAQSVADGATGNQLPVAQPVNTKLLYATFALVLLAVMFQIGERLLFNESPATNSNPPQNTASVPGGPGPLARFDVTPNASQRLVPVALGTDFALSPDGSRIVYVGPAPGGGTQLWQRALEDLEAVPIRGTEGAASPAMSPDGQSVAFYDTGSLRTVSLAGGPAVTVASGNAFAVPAWGADGRLYFARDRMLYRVAATGGEIEPVTAPA